MSTASNYWVFGGNHYRKSEYSYNQALELSKTLINCVGCINCSYCTDCTSCASSEYCSNCNKCCNCRNCHNSNDLWVKSDVYGMFSRYKDCKSEGADFIAKQLIKINKWIKTIPPSGR